MTSTNGAQHICRVAVLLFPGADILDFAGPIEVLSLASRNTSVDKPEPIFAVQTVGRAEDAPVPTGANSLLIQPSMKIAELLETLASFRVLIVPGGNPSVMRQVIATDDGLELEVIQAFAKLPPAADGQERIVLSVCTGAFLLGAAGLLSGLKVTTHHMALQELKTICDAADARNGVEAETNVVAGQRFVDSGISKDGLRIVTAGGVSSGLDAALHLVELVKDGETAEFIAKMMEYERRQK